MLIFHHFILTLNFLHFHYYRNSTASSTICISVNAGFGAYISKCLCRLFMAIAGQACSYFDNFSHISFRILIILCYLCQCVIMLRYKQGFNPALLSLCRFYSEFYLHLCPTSPANSPHIQVQVNSSPMSLFKFCCHLCQRADS